MLYLARLNNSDRTVKWIPCTEIDKKYKENLFIKQIFFYNFFKRLKIWLYVLINFFRRTCVHYLNELKDMVIAAI